LGHGTEEGEKEVATPRKVKAAPKAIRLLASGGMSNAVVDDEGVWTWGCSDQGALGREGDENFPALVTLPLRGVIVGVSLGDTHGACVSLGGALMLWGSYRDSDGKAWFPAGTDGTIGPGAVAASPRVLEQLSNVTHVACGSNHTLALCGDGAVWSVGIGEQGQLGRPVRTEVKDRHSGEYDVDALRQHLTPARVQGLDAVTRAIGAGAYHSLAVSATRCRVFACGLNQYRQVIDASDNVVTAMRHVAALEGKRVAQVDGGEHYSVARTAGGAVLSWGRSDQHQLGHAELARAEAGGFCATPKAVAGLSDVVDVACGSAHVLARTGDGSLYTWGFGEMLQLGHAPPSSAEATGQDEAVPRKVAGLGNVKRISAGGQHSCALVA